VPTTVALPLVTTVAGGAGGAGGSGGSSAGGSATANANSSSSSNANSGAGGSATAVGGAGGAGGAGGSVTIYANDPTKPTSEPADSPVIEIPLPVVDFPVITSPRTGSLIVPIQGNVYVLGTGPANQTIRLVTATGDVVGAGTSDAHGNWRILAAAHLFHGAKQIVRAELLDGTASTWVRFSFKRSTLTERVLQLVTPGGITQ
jgi:hypothetical protein